MREKGLINIYILEILARYSSEKHRLMQKDILYYLDTEYMLKVNRNTLSAYLSELKAGQYIAGDRGVYLLRKFTNSEIKGLINNILYTKTMPEKTVKRLIEILKSMAEPDIRNRIYNTYFINSINYIENKNINEIIDAIDEAIYRRKKIEYIGCKYDIDGMLKETEVSAFNIENYIKEHIYMYSGGSEAILMKIDKKHIGDFIDWFGKNYKVMQNDSEFVIRIKANVNAVYFWALQYSEIAEVLYPDSLRQRIKAGALKIAEKYS